MRLPLNHSLRRSNPVLSLPCSGKAGIKTAFSFLGGVSWGYPKEGKFELFQQASPPHKYTLANNKENALPTAYLYTVIRIFLNAEDNLNCRGFPLEGNYLHNIALFSRRHLMDKVPNPHSELTWNRLVYVYEGNSLWLAELSTLFHRQYQGTEWTVGFKL